jgi:hypothetical protein
MKKITLALLVLLTALASNSQSIVPRGTPTNTMQDYRLDVKNNLVVPRYLDTATANLTANKGLDSSGAIIKTYNPDAIWVRQSNPKRWFNLTGLSSGGTLATVATTGAYSDLIGKPTIPAAQVQSDWNATSGLGVILNKPISTNVAMTVATLRTTTTTTNTVYDLLDHGGGQVQDLGLNDGSYVDDDGMTFISGNAHTLKRVVSTNEVTPEYWRAKVDDGLSDTAAFGKMTRYCLYNGAAINISAKGIYNFDGSWIIPGSPLTGLGINIHSTHEAVLKFGHLASGIAVQYGTPNSNTLNGVVDDLHVEADSTVDGFVVSSHAPYSASFNTFNNLFLYGVKDGVHFDGLSSNTSSNYQLTFNNLRVQKFWGHAIHNTGAMITFNHGFAVMPYGNGLPARAGTGANSLAVYDLSSASTYNGIRTEDQWVLNGAFTRVSGQSTIEYIVKDVQNSEAGSTAMRIAGANVTVDGFDFITVPNNIVNEFMQVYSPGVSLKNIVYNNPGNDPRYIITYPILPSNTSSGVMENVNVKTVYPVNHPAFADGVKNWSFVNVLGLGDTVFARIKNLEMSALVETDPSFVNAAKLSGAGQTISAFTTINDFKVATSSEMRGINYDFQNHYNSHPTLGYVAYNTLDVPTGTRSLDYITKVNANYRGPITSSSAWSIDSAVTLTTGGVSPVARLKETHIDGNNGGLNLQYKALGTFKNGLTLDYNGDIRGTTLEFVLNVQKFGAFPNDGVDDAAAFDAAVAAAKTYVGSPTIVIPAGRYNFSHRLIIDGFAWNDSHGYATWTGIKVRGDGGTSSVLDFSASTNGGLFYGSGATNTLNGGISNISIIGNANIDGLTVISTAPYTTRNNHFDNLYITQVRDGYRDSAGTSFTSSNHDNFVSKTVIEGYSRYGIHQAGAYNTISGCFIVHPNGSGAKTLAILEEGQGNTYNEPTFEDQFWLRGYDNAFNNFKMEKVIKTVGFDQFFGQAFQLDGVNDKLLGGKINDVENTIISAMGYVVGTNTNISNIQYRNEESVSNHILPNPIIFENASSGVLDNVITNTTNKLDKPGYYERATLNWSMTNIDGENGLFNKAVNEIRVEAPPTTGTWAAGVKAINKTPLIGEPTGWVRSIVGVDSTWKPYGGVGSMITGVNDYVPKLDGTNSLINSHLYTPSGATYDRSGHFQLDVPLASYPQITFGSGGPLLFSGTDSLLHYFKNPTYDVNSHIIPIYNFNGTLPTQPALSLDNAVPLSQLKDSLAGYHRLTDSTPFHIGEYLTGNGTLATPLNVDISKVLQTGTLSFTGDGVTTSFTIILDIVGMSPASTILVTASNSVGAAIDYIDVSTESITIYYLTAPTSGVKNLKYLIKP